MKLSLGFSPCPNDTFIFEAMVHKYIDTLGLDFEVILGDVEALNLKAMAGELDITKLSFHAFGHVMDQYALLESGSALGNNCGPLLISKKKMTTEELKTARIAIPGKLTTANFLLSLAYPEALNKYEIIFSEIENEVLNGRADAGLIIHENRFTYHEKGLVKIVDLGSFWEDSTNMPIPLGGIVVKKALSPEIQAKVSEVMKQSVLWARNQSGHLSEYVKSHAQEMEETVMKQHINLYVNEFTEGLGTKGRAAVNTLFAKAQEKGILSTANELQFV